MRNVIGIFSCFLLLSCSDSFINHKLKFDKTGDCRDYSRSIKMISNINGERYEFFCCMDDGFDGKNYVIERKGDSIIVSFPKTTENKKVLYNLILDVDAKPRYNYIILDDRELRIVPAEK